jgi:organic hydroperoxide reductase OsmC/OhrA
MEKIMQRGPHFYETSLRYEEDRRGTASSPGLPDLPFSAPPEFNGEPGYWSPEHLYVLAAETCLMATFVAIAEYSELPVRSYSSTARGKLEWIEGQGYRFTELEIRPKVEIEKEADREKALKVLQKAEKGCLIARSMSANIAVVPDIVVSAANA